MSIWVFSLMVVMRESKDIKNSLSLPLTSNLILVLSEIIKGRAFRLCGAIGVITILFEFGKTTGPLQLKEYPVEPVGVETMSPSAQ